MNVYSFLFGFIFVTFFGSIRADPDLEDYIPDFVLETRKLEITEFPHAFNPSIIRWHNQLLMSFRVISKPIISLGNSSAEESFIYIVQLDDDFHLIGHPQKLCFGSNLGISRAEDARLISMEEQLYIIYSDNRDEILSNGGFRVYIAKLHYDGKQFTIIQDECLRDFEEENCNKREKNWIPFVYQGNLLLSYTITPHKILYPLLNESGKCETFIKTKPSIVWEWGELRGGTPGLLIDDQCYLAFFHSSADISTVQSNGKKMLHYFIGAYTFSREPPFAIEQVSPEPIVGNNFYNGEIYDPYWKPVRVVFPCGFIEEKEVIWLSYGRQDHEIWFAKIDKKGLFDSLIQVSTVP